MVTVMHYYSLLRQKLKEEEDFYFEEGAITSALSFSMFVI